MLETFSFIKPFWKDPHVWKAKIHTGELKVRVLSSEKKDDIAKPKESTKVPFLSFWKRKLSRLRFRLQSSGRVFQRPGHSVSRGPP